MYDYDDLILSISHITIQDPRNWSLTATQLEISNFIYIMKFGKMYLLIIMWIASSVTFQICILKYFMPVPLKKSQYTYTKAWITTKIKTSCANKRKLHLMCRDGNYCKLKEHYRQHCKTLMQVIIAVKKLCFNNLLFNSNNNKQRFGAL